MENSAGSGGVFDYIIDVFVKFSLRPMVTLQYLTSNFINLLGGCRFKRGNLYSTNVAKNNACYFGGTDFDAPGTIWKLSSVGVVIGWLHVWSFYFQLGTWYRQRTGRVKH